MQHRRASLAGQTTNTNYFAPLGASDDENDDENGENGQYGDRNNEADQYDTGDETARLYLQRPTASATVRSRFSRQRPNSDLRP